MTARLRRALPFAPLALVAYVPLLLTARGQVAADTKTYLYLDPAKLLSRAWSMWDPNIGLGTVTHQNIGYLWPMGPWFWAFEQLGSPDWVAQRLWVATIMFAAGAGVVFLARTLGLRSVPAILAAALVYELSPYVLHYASRISVLLLPWAALPWLIAIVQRALRRGGWREPAIFALVVVTVGGVNATALVLAGIGPLLWVPFAVLSHREVTWAAAARTVARIGALTIATSLWWIAGLWVQSGWGIDILRYTETVATVARTSLSSEVLRGLGYWFFYGGDKLGPWIEPGRSYTQSLTLIAIGFVLPVLAILAAAVTRWRYRAFFVVLMLLGTATAVGAYPYHSPSLAGALFKRFAATSSAGLALRSTPRALPLVVLAIAMLVALGIGALSTRNRRAGLAAAAIVIAVAVANIPPLWQRDVIGSNLQRPEEIPTYWHEAAAWLAERGDGTRILEIPGADFASYRWGNTVDPITPGLLDRPYVARELIPYGTPASADLLIALDRRLQESILDTNALSPVARLMGVGDVVLRSDLQYERYRLPRPAQVWGWLQPTPKGLDDPIAFGKGVTNEAIPLLPLHDEVFLSLPPDAPQPPAVAAFPVPNPLPIVRLRDAGSPIVLAGDGEGLVEAASLGMIGGSDVIRYSASLSDSQRADILEGDASLILTDTNRKRGRRWATVRDNAGYTESAIESPLRHDPADARLDVFPDAPVDAFTTTVQRGVRSVRATTYGNPVTYTPEDRAALAIDGDPNTAWRVGAFSPVKGERWALELERPVTTDHIVVVQPLTDDNRHITELGVTIDGRRVDTVSLRRRSLTEKGQRIDLGRQRTFSRLELEVVADNVGFRGRYDGYSGVGLAEVRVGDVRVDEIIQLPTDLLDERAARHPLSILLTRARSNPIEPTAGDEEPAMKRRFDLPGGRTFQLTGEARASALRSGDDIDALLGVTASRARSSRRLTGDLTTRASATIDDDPTTAWTTGLFDEQLGEWVEIVLDETRTIDAIDLAIVADPYHSTISKLRITSNRGEATTARVPKVPTGSVRGHVERVRVELGKPLTGRTFRFHIRGVRVVKTTEWYSVIGVQTPVAIAEIDLPAASATRPRGPIPSQCRDDLLTVDGRPVSIRVTGDAVAAERRDPLDVALCGPDASGLRLDAGPHELLATPGWRSGFDLDRLALTSDARGRATRPPTPGAAPTGSDVAELTVVDRGRDHVTVELDADEPVWLVLGQSYSDGWSATGLGRPTLVDGFANGWLVEPGGDGPTRITMRFTPQRTVNVALGLSLLAVLACFGIVVLGGRRRVAAAQEPAVGSRAWLVEPWTPVGQRPSMATTALTAAGLGAVAVMLAHPLIGLAVAIATAGALLVRRGPGVLAALAVGSVGLAGAFTIAKQARNHFPPDFGWPSFFSTAHHLAWLGLLLMVASIVVDRVRRRAAPPAPPRTP